MTDDLDGARHLVGLIVTEDGLQLLLGQRALLGPLMTQTLLGASLAIVAGLALEVTRGVLW